MILLTIDRKETKPLYRQIAGQIKEMIESDLLIPGDRLPPTRELAERLRVNRTTVTRAYEELFAFGYLESRAGSHTRVRKRTSLAETTESGNKESFFKWEERLNPAVRKIVEKSGHGQSGKKKDTEIDFATLSPDPVFWPVDDFRSCMNRVLSERSTELLDYEDPRGNYELRNELARYLKSHRIKTDPGELLITNGSQRALDLVFGSLSSPGSSVICGDPTYSSIFSMAEYHGTKLIRIPLNGYGLDLKLLEEEGKNRKISFLYTMPSFQNPTGITTSQEHREKLLNICEKYEIPLVEDGFVEELKYTGGEVLPIKSMDRKGIVIYTGTFSKMLFPGLRIGWIAADSGYIEKLAAIKKITELCGSSAAQAAMALFLRKGFFEKYLRKIHSGYRKRITAAMKSCKEFLDNPDVSWTRPSGGYTFWVTWKDPPMDENELVKQILTSGISVSPGSRFTDLNSRKINFRISIARSSPDEIREGLKRIGCITRKGRNSE